MPQPVSLKGHQHKCPVHNHQGGPITATQQSFVTVNGVAIATVGDVCVCTGIPTDDQIAEGSALAFIEGKKVARLNDKCAHGGEIVEGVTWIKFD
ncbi:PAAR domain-containing protein [Rhizobium sp. Leaf311]|uniref:PAAR domain-containing protein n=1 Tax=Rhizobium sp. Leaf311 TaxID=1736332 RepID=UPI000786FA6E|nr:PAAR domain-containing protein [Rhizobium sp. Leaf311]